MPNPIDLSALQACAEPLFAEWTRTAKARDNVAANLARREIMRQSKEATKGRAGPEGQGGLYLFTNNRKPDDLARLGYIGLAKNRPLEERLRDYLVKEISVLDPTLLNVSEECARQLIRERIKAAMPRSLPKVDAYVKSHMKSRLISSANLIMLYNTETKNAQQKNELEGAETVLIRAAHCERSSLINIKKRHLSRSVPAASIELALEAVSKWEREGLGTNLALQWRAQITNLE